MAIAVVVAVVASDGRADAPPAIADSFARLADAEASVRAAARVELMGIGRDRLGELREVAEAATPLDPAQEAVLRDIVTHVFLTGETYASDGGSGFMGVSMSQSPIATEGRGQPGVVVIARVPGFAAYRALEVGDVILDVGVRRLEPVAAIQQLIDTVRRIPPGTDLQLRVLRGGERVEVSLRLDRRPRVADDRADPMAYEQFMDERQDRADAYWQAEFAPLVTRAVS